MATVRAARVEVSYWRSWQPGTEAAQAGLRGVRISASAWASVRGPADLFTETAAAVLAVAADADVTEAPEGWADDRYARVATGRLPLSPSELAELGSIAERFPLFG